MRLKGDLQRFPCWGSSNIKHNRTV